MRTCHYCKEIYESDPKCFRCIKYCIYGLSKQDGEYNLPLIVEKSYIPRLDSIFDKLKSLGVIGAATPLRMVALQLTGRPFCGLRIVASSNGDQICVRTEKLTVWGHVFLPPMIHYS